MCLTMCMCMIMSFVLSFWPCVCLFLGVVCLFVFKEDKVGMIR